MEDQTKHLQHIISLLKKKFLFLRIVEDSSELPGVFIRCFPPGDAFDKTNNSETHFPETFRNFLADAGEYSRRTSEILQAFHFFFSQECLEGS